MFGALVLPKWSEIEPMYPLMRKKSFVWSNACFPVPARSLQIIEMQVYF